MRWMIVVALVVVMAGWQEVQAAGRSRHVSPGTPAPAQEAAPQQSGGGSTVKGAVVNQSDVSGAANISSGAGNVANMGTVRIKGSTVGGVVSNSSDVAGAANVSIGQGNQASTGSVNVE